MAVLNAPAMECDRVNLRWSVPVQKRQQIFETVPVRHRGTSFGSAKLFQCSCIAADLSPDFQHLSAVGSVVQRGWRSGQATRATYSRSAPPDQSARSARRARPLKRTALLAKPVNGINAPQRPDCVADDAVSCELVSAPNFLLYRLYATTRNSSGEMIRKLSVIRSRKRSHFLVTVRLRKRRIADLNCAKVS